MAYVGLTNYQITNIQKKIMNASWNNTQMLKYFQAHSNAGKNTGLIKNVGKGIKKHTYTKFEKMKPGQVSRGFQDLPDSHMGMDESTTTLCELSTKVVIPVQQRDAWASQTLVGEGDMIQQAVNQQMLSLTNQVDQFLAQGDNMKTPLTGDKAAGEGKYTGMFNSGTLLGGGDGKDNNVSAAGDYIADFANRITALNDGGFEPEKAFIFSTNGTWNGAQASNNLITTNNFTTEWQAVMARPDVMDWLHSSNFEDPDGNDQIMVTTPMTGLGEPAYRLLQGYNFDVIPLYNGGLGPTAMYELIVTWSGALEVIHDAAIQYSGTLTL